MPLLNIDYKTDYNPGTDFSFVEIILSKRGKLNFIQYQLNGINSSPDGLTRRAALFKKVKKGSFLVVIKLLDSRGRVVDMARSILDMPGNAFSTTILITR